MIRINPAVHLPFPLCVLRRPALPAPVCAPEPTVAVGPTTAVTVRRNVIRVRKDGFRPPPGRRSEEP